MLHILKPLSLTVLINHCSILEVLATDYETGVARTKAHGLIKADLEASAAYSTAGDISHAEKLISNALARLTTLANHDFADSSDPDVVFLFESFYRKLHTEIQTYKRSLAMKK